MSDSITIETQTTEELRNQAAQILDQLGLNFSTYINMALNQLVIQEGIPFEVKLNPKPENAHEIAGVSLVTEEELKLIKDHRVNTPKTILPEELLAMKTVDRIVELMKVNPAITAREIAKMVGTTVSGVNYHIKNLKASGRIARDGADNGGKWRVIEKEE